MELRGINFPPIFTASGTQGFFGSLLKTPEYWYHRSWSPWRFRGLTFEDCGFIAKTTTLHLCTGNMPMKKDGITPLWPLPRCIRPNFFNGTVLNAVGLSGPGAASLLERNLWQSYKGTPWFLSFMAKSGKDDPVQVRLDQTKELVRLLLQHDISNWNARVGLEINLSCPTTDMDLAKLPEETGQSLDIAAELNIPLQLKFNALVSPEIVANIARHEACDAITMSNTIPFGKLPEKINWKELFGSDISPLAHLGGGGLSGWPLAPIVNDWIRKVRQCGIQKPIWACGGINSITAVHNAHAVGASGIQVGTVAMLHPSRMKGIIQTSHQLFR